MATRRACGGGVPTGTEAYVYVSQLAQLASDLDIILAETGSLAASFAIVYAISAPVIAAKTADLDRRTLVVVGLAAIAVRNLLAATEQHFGALLAIRIACGLAAQRLGAAIGAVTIGALGVGMWAWRGR